MSDPPGSTAYVRFEAVPLLTILRGPDAAAGFASPATDAPGSTAFVAFDTVPGLWFDFPALPGRTPAGPVASVAATRPVAGAAGRKSPSRRPATRTRVAQPKRSLAATGGSDTPVLAALGLLLTGWLVQRGRREERPSPNTVS